MSPVNPLSDISGPDLSGRETWTPVRRAAEVPSARSLLLTMLGEFVLRDGGAAWTNRLIDGLGVLGVDEGAARQALARSSTRGLIESERVGRRTRWSLTDRARTVLTEGAARIYGFGSEHPAWDGRWLLVMTSVPEANRHLRAALRNRMTWLGFGALGPGTWVSPWASREAGAQRILDELGVVAGCLSWVGRPGLMGSVEDRVAEIWDLDAVAADYVSFTARARSERPGGREESFGALVRLVHDWRHFPAADPGLPEELLPPSWPSSPAAKIFRDRRAEWLPAAWQWWRSR